MGAEDGTPNTGAELEELEMMDVQIGNTTYQLPRTPETERIAQDYAGGYDTFQTSRQEAATAKALLADTLAKQEEEEPPADDDDIKAELLERGFIPADQVAQMITEGYAAMRLQERQGEVIDATMKFFEDNKDQYPGFDKMKVLAELEGLGLRDLTTDLSQAKVLAKSAYDLSIGNGADKTIATTPRVERASVRSPKLPDQTKPKVGSSDEERDAALQEAVNSRFAGMGE